MVDQWWYRLFDREFGPLPFERLREVAQEGTLGKSDAIRHGATGDWVAAERVPGLFDVAVPFATEGNNPSIGAETSSAAAPAADHLEQDWKTASGWSQTVAAALAKVDSQQRRVTKRRHRRIRVPLAPIGAVLSLLLRPLGWLTRRITGIAQSFGWLDRFLASAEGALALGDKGLTRVSLVSRVVSATVCGGLAGLAIHHWTLQKALRTVDGATLGRPFAGRSFPFLGECTRLEYWFLLIDVMLIVAAAVYFLSASRRTSPGSRS